MNDLMTALIEANVNPESAKKALTSIEGRILSMIKESQMQLQSEFLFPLEKEQANFRLEKKFDSELNRESFERYSQEIKHQIDKVLIEVRANRETSDSQNKITRESLESQIKATRENLEAQIKATRESLEAQIKANERLILSTKENLEAQIKNTREVLEKQLGFQQKLLWVIVTIVLGSFLKSFFI